MYTEAMYPDEMYPEGTYPQDYPQDMYPEGDGMHPEEGEATEDKLYVKLAHIGEGSYADVYLATPREPQLFGQQQFVIKELDVMSMEEKDQKKAVLEVNILSTLKHPNIIGYRESYIHDGFLCIVMEHADGGDLFHQISNARDEGYFFEEKVILNWLAQILLALQYVHSNQLLHRDIKPQNIFLLANGMVKLGDFGVSRVLENVDSLASTTTGTPCYFSPELCRNDPYDAKSDLWALGCITYEMAQLVPPFPSENMGQMCKDIINEEPTPLPAHYSNDLRVLIKMMMEKNPEHRPTAAQLLAMPVLRKVCKRLPWARAQTTACLSGIDGQRQKKRSSRRHKTDKADKKGKQKSDRKKHRNRSGSLPVLDAEQVAQAKKISSEQLDPIAESEVENGSEVLQEGAASVLSALAGERQVFYPKEPSPPFPHQEPIFPHESTAREEESPLFPESEKKSMRGVSTKRGVSASSKASSRGSTRGEGKLSARGENHKVQHKDKCGARGNENKWGCSVKIGEGKESSRAFRPKNIKTSSKARAQPASALSPECVNAMLRHEEQRKFEELAQLGAKFGALPAVVVK